MAFPRDIIFILKRCAVRRWFFFVVVVVEAGRSCIIDFGGNKRKYYCDYDWDMVGRCFETLLKWLERLLDGFRRQWFFIACIWFWFRGSQAKWFIRTEGLTYGIDSWDRKTLETHIQINFTFTRLKINISVVCFHSQPISPYTSARVICNYHSMDRRVTSIPSFQFKTFQLKHHRRIIRPKIETFRVWVVDRPSLWSAPRSNKWPKWYTHSFKRYQKQILNSVRLQRHPKSRNQSSEYTMCSRSGLVLWWGRMGARPFNRHDDEKKRRRRNCDRLTRHIQSFRTSFASTGNGT